MSGEDQDQRRQKIKYAVRTQQYIDTLFEIESNSLKNIETDLGDFKLQNNIYDLSAEGSALLNETSLLDQESQQIQRRIELGIFILKPFFIRKPSHSKER